MTAGVSAGLVPEPAEDDETGGYIPQDYEFATCGNELVNQKDTVDEHYTHDVRFVCRVSGLVEHGRYPHPGGYLDQPAKLLLALNVFGAAKYYARIRLRERQEFLNGGMK